MRLSTHLSGAALALVLRALAVAASDVLDLTPSNFESTIGAESLILVEFFAPWCGHCKALAPHYEEAATALKEKNIKIAKVNCVDEPDLCQEHGVQGYPTLKVFRDGEPSDYSGPRKADGIISYMTKQALPAVSEVTIANLEEFKAADKIVAIAYLPSSTDAPAPEFSSAANKHRDDYLFGLTTDAEAIAAAGVTPPAIVLYRKFDEPVSTFPYPALSATTKEIENWIAELSIPIIDEVGAENYATYSASGKPLAYLFLDPTEEHREEHIAAIRPVAEKYKGKVNFVWIDAVKFGDHAKALNLNEATWPSFVIQDMVGQLKYPYDQANKVTGGAIGAFVEEFVSGSLKPQLKSAPIPESQDEPTITLVSKQFEEIVYDDSKDVFVEFYATWCGHCKRLKPIWDQLGEHFAAVKDKLTIAKMEATENDLPADTPFRISGFPTLKFKPAGGREWVDYDGDRSLESMIAFVEETAKNSLEAAKVVPEAAPTDTIVDEDVHAQKPVGHDHAAHGHDHGHEHHDEL